MISKLAISPQGLSNKDYLTKTIMQLVAEINNLKQVIEELKNASFNQPTSDV